MLIITSFKPHTVLMAGVHAQKKEIDKLESEKEALSQKHSTDSEITKYVTTS